MAQPNSVSTSTSASSSSSSSSASSARVTPPPVSPTTPPPPLSPPSQPLTPLTPLTPLHSLSTFTDRRPVLSESVRRHAKHIHAHLSIETLPQLSDFHIPPHDITVAYEHQTALDEAGVYETLLSLFGRSCDVFILHIFETLCIDLIHTNSRLVIDTFSALLSQPQLIQPTLRTLCHFLHNDHCRCTIIPRTGLLPTVISLLSPSTSDVILLHCIRLLTMCCLNSRSNQTQVCTHALPLILPLTRSRPRTFNPLLCALIRNLAVSRADLILQLDKQNCVQFALLSLQSPSSSVALHALSALFHLIHPPPPPPTPRYTPPPSNQQAVPKDSPYTITTNHVLRFQNWEHILFQTSRKHSGKAGVQSLIFALAARCAIVGGAQACRKIVAVNLLHLCLTAINRHVNKRHVVYYGSRLVRVVLEGGSGGGMEQVREWGGVDRLLDMLYCTVVSDVSGGKGEWEGGVDVLQDFSLSA